MSKASHNTHHLLSLPPYTEPLKHYSAPVSQPVSILFVISRFSAILVLENA